MRLRFSELDVLHGGPREFLGFVGVGGDEKAVLIYIRGGFLFF